jgi:hypothetical protein
MAFIGVEQGAYEMAVLDEGEVVLGLLHRDDLGRHAQVTSLGNRGLEELHALGRVGQHDAGRKVQSAGLARDLFQFLVQAHRVALQHGDVRVAVERVKPSGRVPGRARRELVALEQQDVLPPLLGQVVQDRASHHAATNHDHLCCCLHVWVSFSCAAWLQ